MPLNYNLDELLTHVKPTLYKVVKIGRKSARKTIIRKNLSLEDAKILVNSYPDSSRSMVVFYRQN